MGYFYSPSKMGFYHSDIHNQEGIQNPIPKDAIEITDKEYKDIWDAKSAPGNTKTIQPGPDGKPVLADQVFTKGDKARIKYSNLRRSITPELLADAVLGTDGGLLKKTRDEMKKLESQIKEK